MPLEYKSNVCPSSLVPPTPEDLAGDSQSDHFETPLQQPLTLGVKLPFQEKNLEPKEREEFSFLQFEALEETMYFSPENAKRKRVLPPGVHDFDEECGSDPFQSPQYAQDIFLYFKQLELKFIPQNYMVNQNGLTCHSRAVLIDFLVEMHGSEQLQLCLNETLYSAVRLADLYLSRTCVKKEDLQLIGVTAMLISTKFEECRIACVNDFLGFCDPGDTRETLITKEIEMLQSVNFQIGLSLPFRFLRRYGRVSKTDVITYTLSLYILETSLMEYGFINIKDSLMASSALMMAFQMQNFGDWTPTLEYYSGFTKADLRETTHLLHAMLIKPKSKKLTAIRNKYSKQCNFRVAEFPVPTVLQF